MKILTPYKWTKGQTIFNFLEWLRIRGYDTDQSLWMANPSYIENEELDELYEEFLGERVKILD